MALLGYAMITSITAVMTNTGTLPADASGAGGGEEKVSVVEAKIKVM